MAEVMHAFVSGIGAGLAFALCQALTMWVAQRRADRAVAEASRRMQAQMEATVQAWEAARGDALRTSSGRIGGDAN